MTRTFALMLILVASWAIPLPASASANCIALTGQQAIVLPGSYCMTRDENHNGTSGTFFLVDAPRVTIDCGGFSINNTTNDPASFAVAISVEGVSNVTIRNCNITGGWQTGILALQTNTQPNINRYLVLEDNSITGATWYGIYAQGSGMDIHGNHIHDIGGRASFAMGIRVGGSTVAGQPRSFVVRDNVVTGTHSPVNNAYGIYGDNTLFSVFDGNVVSGTVATSMAYGAYGIRLNGGNNYNRVTNNNIGGTMRANEVGIQTTSNLDACYHNFVRTSQPATLTVNCDASLGNH
jgi:hypothetical protein